MVARKELGRGITCDFKGTETILYDIIMVGTCHYIFIQTHSIYNTKSDPIVNYRLWLVIMYQYWLMNCNKRTILMQDVNNRGGWGMTERVQGNSALFTQSFYKSKTTLKIKSIFLNQEGKVAYLSAHLLTERS